MFRILGIINENFPTFFLKHKREKCFFAKVAEMEYKREKLQISIFFQTLQNALKVNQRSTGN
jgi:hypothetical protein